jgi:hypothetical protein
LERRRRSLSVKGKFKTGWKKNENITSKKEKVGRTGG